MIFDTWGGVLNPAMYRAFSLDYMQRIVDQLTREADGRTVPVVLFTKGAGVRLSDMANTGADALGVDWTTDLADARQLTGDKVALQGNLDPAALYASPDTVRAEVRRVLESFGQGEGHVFNLGHGVTPDIDPDCVAAAVDEVIQYSPQFHAS